MPSKRWKDQERRVAKAFQPYDPEARRAWLSRMPDNDHRDIVTDMIDIDVKSTVNTKSIRIKIEDLDKIRGNSDRLGIVVGCIKNSRRLFVIADFEDLMNELFTSRE